jgi:tetratricopeptide (TPR) repeat protein
MYALGMALHRLGYAYLLKGEIDQALPLLEQCRDLAERAELPVLIMHLGSCLGQAYCLVGRADEAVALIEKARSMEEAGGNMLWVPVNLTTLATAYSALRRSTEALETAELALDCARRFGQRGNEAWALLTRGDVLLACESSAHAQIVDAYASAMALGLELKMLPLVARCHLAMALHSGMELAERRQHRDIAKKMFSDMDMKLWVAKAAAAVR